MKKKIEQLVSELPEIYQTIYGYSELSTAVSRECHDRLIEIDIIYTSLETKLGRPLRVLDFGCAQGFFCFSLAKRGASVVGVDFQKENIDLCKALAEENPEMDVRFLQGRIEEIIPSIGNNEYDLITGLSVFHHIVHQHGLDTVKGWIEELANKTSALIFELALHEEPLYWASSLPEDPRELLKNCHFVHEIGRFSTHLSDIGRPLYIVSNRFWIFGNEIEEFTHWTTESHAKAQGAHQGTRRYYFSHNRIAKVFELSLGVKERNEKESLREIDFLKSPPTDYKCPKLFSHGRNDNETWLVMEKIPGVLLVDAINSGFDYDAHKAINSLLEKLVILERNGLYHDDIRIWNLLLQEDSSLELIDFGSFTKSKEDCSWPFNIYFSFIILIYEVANHKIYNSDILRPLAMSPYSLPEPYSQKIETLWEKPLESWSFKEIHELISLDSEIELSNRPNKIQKVWMQVVDSVMLEYLELNSSFKRDMVNIKEEMAVQNGQYIIQFNDQKKLIDNQLDEIQNIKAELDILKAAEQSYVDSSIVDEIEELVEMVQTQDIETANQELLLIIEDLTNQLTIKTHHIHDLENHIIAVRKSTSWKLTWPLRKIKNFLADPFSRSRFSRIKMAFTRILLAILKKFIFIANDNPKIKNFLLKAAHKTKTYGVMKRVYYKYKKNSHVSQANSEPEIETARVMSSRAKKINSLLVKFDNSKRKQ